MGQTKDEKFLLCLYDLSEQSEEKDFDIAHVAKETGIGPKAAVNISKLLMQANMIKIRGQNLTITPHGVKVAKSLLL